MCQEIQCFFVCDNNFWSVKMFEMPTNIRQFFSSITDQCINLLICYVYIAPLSFLFSSFRASGSVVWVSGSVVSGTENNHMYHTEAQCLSWLISILVDLVGSKYNMCHLLSVTTEEPTELIDRKIQDKVIPMLLYDTTAWQARKPFCKIHNIFWDTALRLSCEDVNTDENEWKFICYSGIGQVRNHLWLRHSRLRHWWIRPLTYALIKINFHSITIASTLISMSCIMPIVIENPENHYYEIIIING